MWGSTRVVSSEWVERATTSTGPLPPGWPPEYAFGDHWEIRLGFFTAVGQNGQIIRYSPENDLVVVIVAGGGPGYHGGENANLIEVLYRDYILPAVRSSQPLPPDPVTWTRFRRLLRRYPLPPARLAHHSATTAASP